MSRLFPTLCQECAERAPEYWTHAKGHICSECWESLTVEEKEIKTSIN